MSLSLLIQATWDSYSAQNKNTENAHAAAKPLGGTLIELQKARPLQPPCIGVADEVDRNPGGIQPRPVSLPPVAGVIGGGFVKNGSVWPRPSNNSHPGYRRQDESFFGRIDFHPHRQAAFIALGVPDIAIAIKLNE